MEDAAGELVGGSGMEKDDGCCTDYEQH